MRQTEFQENLLTLESWGGAALGRLPAWVPAPPVLAAAAEFLASTREGEGNAAGATSSIRRKTLLSFLKM